MTTYKLTYFDFPGGRGEPIRIAFHAAGIELDDERLSFKEFMDMRQTTRFNSLPVLEIDGAAVTQSNAISRHIGRIAGLYPEDPLQSLYCDEVLGALEDINHYLVRTFGLEGDELKKARQKFADGWLTVYIKGLGELLERSGGEYFSDSKLTIADLKAFVQIRHYRSGNLDHVPIDLVDTLAPALVEHQQLIESHPVVAGYYASLKTGSK